MTEDAAADIDDLTRFDRFRFQALHDIRVTALGDEADVLGVGLFSNRKV
jgi:hypothetical protein